MDISFAITNDEVEHYVCCCVQINKFRPIPQIDFIHLATLIDNERASHLIITTAETSMLVSYVGGVI
jgi:hypothetical protein